MNKAFTKESEDDEPEKADIQFGPDANYMTPVGFAALQDELRHLLSEERPQIVATVTWAAGNGDRSENGDYIYGKKRLREIDRRVRYLTKRLSTAKVVDPSLQKNLDKVFFGATVTYRQADGVELSVKIVGVDEADLAKNKISWISPVAKAILKSQVGDHVQIHTPSGKAMITILAIRYE